MCTLGEQYDKQEYYLEYEDIYESDEEELEAELRELEAPPWA